MPPKKPVRRTNKKKGGGVPQQANTVRATTTREPAVQIPNFRASAAQENGDTDESSAAGGLYNIYKRATQRFKDGLSALVPSEIFAQDRVQTVMDAVDYIVEKQITIPSVLLEDCRISLSFRQKYAKKLDGGGDEGHEYFILVLNYCFQSLKPLVPQITRLAGKEKAKQFHFTDLELSDSEGEEEKEEDVPIAARKLTRPKEPTHDFTLEDLIKGSDRLQACAFLDSVDRAMEAVSIAYKTLKINMNQLQIQQPEDAQKAFMLVEDVMEAAVITNFCIRQVQSMEEELKLDHPHLNTSYRILGCVCLVSYVDEFNTCFRGWGKSVPKTELTAFIGDVVESGFRNPNSDPQNRVDRLVREFCRTWSLPRAEVAKMVEAVVYVVKVEILTGREDIPAHAMAEMQSLGLHAHSWMRHKAFIGGERNILNTHRLVQGLSNLLMDAPPIKLMCKPSAFGRAWHETRRCTKIQGDMDQLLLGEIMPELLFSCRFGALSTDIPRLDELLPLFKMLRHYLAHPTKPVPLSLSFGMHAVLTSIFDLQGDNHIALLSVATKVTYNHFFTQLQQQIDSELPNSMIWKPNLQKMMGVKLLPTVLGPPVNEHSERRSFWNPCCGGMFNTFICYQINLEAGAFMIDSFAQLRIVLHLYNALQQRNLISGKVPLLTSLDQFFEGVQCIWEGEKPGRDNLVKRFWLVYGTRADVVRRLHEQCRRMVLDPMAPPIDDVMNTRDGDATREMTECRAEHISKSYRRICLGDFSGMVDRYEEHHTNLENVPAWHYNFVVRVNDTLDLMAGEEELLSWNLMAVGGLLNRFIYYLFAKLGWKSFLDNAVATLPVGDRRMDGRRLDPRSFVASDPYKERFAIVMIFVNKILGPLEFLDSVEHDPVLLGARDCLVEFFNAQDPMGTYQYFPTLTEGLGPREAVAAPLFTHRMFS